MSNWQAGDCGCIVETAGVGELTGESEFTH
jgi:hypothetical protein